MWVSYHRTRRRYSRADMADELMEHGGESENSIGGDPLAVCCHDRIKRPKDSDTPSTRKSLFSYSRGYRLAGRHGVKPSSEK
jgi:hypothetical protein